MWFFDHQFSSVSQVNGVSVQIIVDWTNSIETILSSLFLFSTFVRFFHTYVAYFIVWWIIRGKIKIIIWEMKRNGLLSTKKKRLATFFLYEINGKKGVSSSYIKLRLVVIWLSVSHSFVSICFLIYVFS